MSPRSIRDETAVPMLRHHRLAFCRPRHAWSAPPGGAPSSSILYSFVVGGAGVQIFRHLPLLRSAFAMLLLIWQTFVFILPCNCFKLSFPGFASQARRPRQVVFFQSPFLKFLIAPPTIRRLTHRFHFSFVFSQHQRMIPASKCIGLPHLFFLSCSRIILRSRNLTIQLKLRLLCNFPIFYSCHSLSPFAVSRVQ